MNSVSATSPPFPSLRQLSPMGAIAGGIFIIDLFIPLGIAASVLHIAVVLMSLRYRNSQLPLWTAMACSTLTITALFFSPVGGEFWKTLINRGLILFGIWTTAIMGRHQLQQAQTLHVRERFFQDFMETIPVACFSFDRQGTILSWNTAAERIYGYSKKEAVGASSYDLLVTPEAYEKTQDVIAAIFQGKAFESMIWHDRNKKGELGWRAGNLFPAFDTQDQVSHGININIDISAQKTAESELLTKNALLEAILNSSTDAIYAKDQEGKYLLVNQAAVDMIGKPPEAIIGSDNTQLFNPETTKSLKPFDACVFTNTQAIPFETTLSVEGVTKVFSNVKSPLLDTNGKTMGLVGISREITKQKQTQKDLLLTDRVFMNSPDHIAILGRDYRYRRVNHTYENVHGKSSQELLGLSVADLLGKELFDQTVKPMLDQCFLGEEVHYEAWFTFPKDQQRYMSVSYLPLSTNHNDIQEIVVISRDWTERKRAEEVFRKSEERFRTYFETGLLGRAMTSLDKTWLEVNDRLCTMLGYSREELLLKTWAELTYPDDLHEDETQFERLFSGTLESYSMAKRFVRKDGSLIFTNFYVNAVQNPLGEAAYFTAMIEDITQQHEAESRLRENEMFTNSILEHLPIMVFVKAAKDLRFIRVNQAGETLLGHTREELLGKNDYDFFPKNEADFFTSKDRAVLTSRELIDIPEESIHTNDFGVRFLHTKKLPLYNSTGEPQFLLGISEDITERKSLEEALRRQNEALEFEVQRRTERIQELEQRRMQVEKLAALAQVAAGVAHEINNPLASISQSLILLKRAIPAKHPHFRYFAKVEDCIDRMAQITKHLYQLYRPSSPTPTANDLRLPIQSAVEIMHSRAAKNQIAISLVDPPTPLQALVSKGELTQVLCNLLQNAIDASPPQSTIEVNLDSTLDIATIRVVDHGPGISPDVASHIFEPFFTTKQGQADGGMGLGLSISHSLVEGMGGKLDFSTSIGQGTTFTISLPLT